jgi:hypothetical protein
MIRSVKRTSLALAIVLGLGATFTQPAAAGREGRFATGVAVGTLLGLGIAGAYAGPRYYAPDYYGAACYPGPRQRGWPRRSCVRNPYGETVSRGAGWRCWRPTICK